MKYIISLALLFSLFLVSCDMETVIDLDIPPHESVLVLNGLLDTDTNARVVISHSVGAFSSERPSFLQNADIVLYENGDSVSSLLADMNDLIYVHYEDDYSIDSLAMYYYKSDYTPDKNTTYRVEVDHSDYSPISAETFIPDDITVYNIDVDTISHKDKIGLTFSFDDNTNQQNYYRLKLYANCEKDMGYLKAFDKGYLVMMSNDPSFPADFPWGGYTFIGNKVVFSDDLFNGQQKIITLDVQSEFEYGECDTVIIEFSNLMMILIVIIIH